MLQPRVPQRKMDRQRTTFDESHAVLETEPEEIDAEPPMTKMSRTSLQ